jgi:hypothetical protein
MACHMDSTKGHKYNIVVFDYFRKWVESMPAFSSDGETKMFFIFNQVIARFGVPREIFIDHENHFQMKMFSELNLKLGFI